MDKCLCFTGSVEDISAAIRDGCAVALRIGDEVVLVTHIEDGKVCVMRGVNDPASAWSTGTAVCVHKVTKYEDCPQLTKTCEKGCGCATCKSTAPADISLINVPDFGNGCFNGGPLETVLRDMQAEIIALKG